MSDTRFVDREGGVRQLYAAVEALGAAHALLREYDGDDREALTGATADLVYGLNTAVESLALSLHVPAIENAPAHGF